MSNSMMRDKLSPILANMFPQFSVIPFLVEVNQDNFDSALKDVQSFNLNLRQSIPTFGFISAEASPEMITALLNSPSIKYIHFDIPKIQFSDPLAPRDAAALRILDMATRVLPLPSLPAPNLDLPRPEAVNYFANIFDKISMNAMQGLDAPLQNSPFPFFNPLNLPSPFQIGQTEQPLGVDEKIDQLISPEFYPTSFTRELMGIDIAEAEGITGLNIKGAVLDTGVDVTSQQVSGDTDFDNAMTFHPKVDENGHGTHVLTTAFGLATINYRDISVKGIAPDISRIAIKVLGGGIGTGRESDIIKGMELAFLKGAEVINMSLGSSQCNGTGPEPCKTCPECRVITALTQKGIMFAIAGGNSGPEPQTIGCPGCSPDAITVGAVSPKDRSTASFSSRGPIHGRIKPDVASYGVNIYSATSIGSLLDAQGDRVSDGFAILSGTSMATPHIAGFLALLKQKFPQMNAESFKAICEKKGHEKNNDTGFGIPDWSWFQ